MPLELEVGHERGGRLLTRDLLARHGLRQDGRRPSDVSVASQILPTSKAVGKQPAQKEELSGVVLLHVYVQRFV